MDERILGRRMEQMAREQEELLQKHGWIVHYVFDHENDLNGLANIHTHGLEVNFQHLDLQVVLPLHPEVVHGVLAGIVTHIKKGKTFVPDVLTDEVLEGYDVLFKSFSEGERNVLRLIFPDENGKFPYDDGCQEPYNRQLEELPEL